MKESNAMILTILLLVMFVGLLLFIHSWANEGMLACWIIFGGSATAFGIMFMWKELVNA